MWCTANTAATAQEQRVYNALNPWFALPMTLLVLPGVQMAPVWPVCATALLVTFVSSTLHWAWYARDSVRARADAAVAVITAVVIVVMSFVRELRHEVRAWWVPAVLLLLLAAVDATRDNGSGWHVALHIVVRGGAIAVALRLSTTLPPLAIASFAAAYGAHAFVEWLAKAESSPSAAAARGTVLVVLFGAATALATADV